MDDLQHDYGIEAPRVYVDRLSALLKGCPHQQANASGCSACDDQFFGSISEEVGAVTRHFNSKVEWLREMHLTSGVKKAVIRFKHKQARSHVAMIRESQKLLEYVSLMTLNAHSLLEDYDKVHSSSAGAHFKTRLVSSHREILQSPWLIELLALYFNLQNGNEGRALPELCPSCTCDVSNDKLALACMLLGSLKVEIEATCPICLETFFEPMALSCGHILCFSCACSTASIHTYEKLKKAKKGVKCPLCRETNAFADAVRMTELNLLIYKRCPNYWKDRRQRERKERMKEIKDHWSYKPEDVGTAVYMFA